MASEGFNDGSVVAQQAAQSRRNEHVFRRIGEQEVQLARLDERMKAREEADGRAIEGLRTELKAARGDVLALREELARYKGMIGGILLIVTLIGFFLTLFRNQIGGAVARLFER